MHLRCLLVSTLSLSWLANSFNLAFLPNTVFRVKTSSRFYKNLINAFSQVGMLVNVPFYDNIFHGLMFRGNYPIYPQGTQSVKTLDRWTLYSSLEGVLDRIGLRGRPCLLRAACEAASNTLHHDGLLGAALHLILR